MTPGSPSPRTHIITWDDPMIGANAARTLPGLDYLLALMRGDYPAPPISVLMGMRLIEVENGRAVFAVTPAEYLYNPIGTVHGGFACTLLDSALGCAVHSTLAAGTGYMTIELHTHFIRPITKETGEMRAIGEIIHSGRRLATAQARLIDAEGKLYAHGTTSCMIFTP